jgi:hypothetical protein
LKDDIVGSFQLQGDEGSDIKWCPIGLQRYHGRLARDSTRVPADVADGHCAGESAALLLPGDRDVDVVRSALGWNIAIG